MSWLFLIIAGIFEMLGVSSIAYYNRKKTTLMFLILLGNFSSSFLFLYLAMQTLPMGVAYAVWTGIGAAGGAILGMFFHGEKRNWQRVVCIVLILGSVIGLKLIS